MNDTRQSHRITEVDRRALGEGLLGNADNTEILLGSVTVALKMFQHSEPDALREKHAVCA